MIGRQPTYARASLPARASTAVLRLLLAGGTAQAGSLHPPIDRPLAVTSSFCEYRASRLHGGVDLSTNARIGVPVRAVGAGVVTRIKMAPDGYGRALYLRLDDGRTAVYGHLSGLVPSLAEPVRRRQIEKRAYRLDWHLPDDRFRFEAGEIVAWSGQAGTTVPHLHFELRDAANRPIDPLANGLSTADSVPPVIESIRIVPAEPGAHIDGSPFAAEIPLVAGEGTPGVRRYRGRDPIGLEGGARFEVDVYDRDDGRRGKLAVAGGAVEQDGKRVLELRLDRFSWGAAARSRHLYSGLSEEPGARSRVRLDVPADGEDEHLRATAPNRALGWVKGSGPGEVSILFWDRAGNRAEAVLRLGPPSIGSEGERRALDGRAAPANGRLAVVVRAPSAHAARDEPRLLFERGEEVESILLRPIGSDRWIAWFRPGGPGELRAILGELEWRAVTPFHTLERGSEARVIDRSTGVALELAKGGLYGDALVSIGPFATPPDPAPESGLERVGPAVEIGPRTLYFRDPPYLEIPRDGGERPESVHLYRLDRGRSPHRWRRAGGRCGERSVVAAITRPGVYAPFSDGAAPVAGAVAVERGRKGGTVLRWELVDHGAGIDADSVELLVDGAWVLSVFDGPRDRVEARLNGAAAAAGERELLLRAVDLAGNRVEAGTAVVIGAGVAGGG